MNIERMQLLEAHLTALRDQEDRGDDVKISFDMSNWVSPWGGYNVESVNEALKDPTEGCQTTCCIAGWACMLFGDRLDKVSGIAGRRLLGLTTDQAERLFMNRGGFVARDAWGAFGPNSAKRDLSGITLDEAISAIHRMTEEFKAEVDELYEFLTEGEE